jgi:hypothetical protein
MRNNYLARRDQAARCKFGIYAVNPDGSKRATCPVSRHETRENAEKQLKGSSGGFAVLPLPGVTE